ncbi:MAG: MFS transporter, partial [Verrucomicrobia bacterium]|nr:MFS transporter [Cytophagales bacterium]
FFSWASRISNIKAYLHMDDALLGSVLLAAPVGSLLTLPLAGWLITKYGSRHILLLAGIGYSFSLLLLGFATSPAWLVAGLFVFGMGSEVMNIAVNTQAVELEKLYHKPIMSSFHGFFSLGGFAGAGLGGFLIELKLTTLQHFLLMMIFGMLLSVLVFRNLIATESDKDDNQPLFAIPKGVLLGLGIIALCCMFGEGAMADWSGEFMKRTFLTDSGLNALGATAFSLAMAVGRFNGDWLTVRLGGVKILQVSSVLAVLGLVLVLAIKIPVVVIAGFALVGFGFATVVPLVYSAAGHSKTMAPGVALAAVSTLGYFGFLFGPPLIGYVSKLTSLSVAFGLVIMLSIMIGIFANLARKS